MEIMAPVRVPGTDTFPKLEREAGRSFSIFRGVKSHLPARSHDPFESEGRQFSSPCRGLDFLRARNEIILANRVSIEIVGDKRIVFAAQEGEFRRVARRQRLDEFHHGAGSPLRE